MFPLHTFIDWGGGGRVWWWIYRNNKITHNKVDLWRWKGTGKIDSSSSLIIMFRNLWAPIHPTRTNRYIFVCGCICAILGSAQTLEFHWYAQQRLTTTTTTTKTTNDPIMRIDESRLGDELSLRNFASVHSILICFGDRVRLHSTTPTPPSHPELNT